MNTEHILIALKKLVEHEIPCVKSNRKGYDFFIEDISDDIPITAEKKMKVHKRLGFIYLNKK